MRFLCVHMTEGFFYMTGVKARVRSLGTLGMGEVVLKVDVDKYSSPLQITDR